jgi:hypothetical protein
VESLGDRATRPEAQEDREEAHLVDLEEDLEEVDRPMALATLKDLGGLAVMAAQVVLETREAQEDLEVQEDLMAQEELSFLECSFKALTRRRNGK